MPIFGQDDAAVDREVRVSDRGDVKTQPPESVDAKYFLDGGNGRWTEQITNAAGRIRLPEAGGLYYIVAIGQTAYCRIGGNNVTATTAVGGYDFPVPEGLCFPPGPPQRLPGTHISYIGLVAATGSISVVHVRKA